MAQWYGAGLENLFPQGYPSSILGRGVPKMRLSIVVPTYNEKENILDLIGRVGKEFKSHRIDGQLIIVDDNSPDGTGEVAESARKTYPFLRVLHRKGKLGLSSAVLEGWEISNGEALGVMDADLSHPIERIHELFKAIESNEADIAVGSRYVRGGKIEGWSFYRKLMSRGATLLAKIFTNVKDPMSGFFIIRKECIKGKNFDAKGFKILLEVIMKSGCTRIKEVPITFVDRKAGKSKAGMKEILYYLRNLAKYLKYKKNSVMEFLKFAFVGFLGTLINIGVLYSMTEYLKVFYLVSAIFGFAIASTCNYLLNKVWTFREALKSDFGKKFYRFFIVSLIALSVNLAFLYLFTELFGLYYIFAQIIAIVLSLFVNFLGNKLWTFN